MKPTVSVVMPTFNGAKYIEQAIDSALTQTYPSLEIIVVDDGSTDATAEIVKSYGDKVTYILQQNQGTAAAYNTGITAASGDFVAFLEQDDLWEPEKNAHQVRLFATNDRLGMVFSPVHLLQEGVPSKHSDLDDQQGEGECSFADFFARNRVLNCSSVMVRRDVLQHVGGFHEHLKLGFDYDLWLRIAAEYVIYCLAAPLTIYRIHGDNQSKDEHDLLAHDGSLNILISWANNPLVHKEVGRDEFRKRIARLHRVVAWEHTLLKHREEEMRHLWAALMVDPFRLDNLREYLWRRVNSHTRNRLSWYARRIQSAFGRAAKSATRK